MKGSPFKWLDLDTFCYNFLDGAQRIDHIRYFTARVNGQQDADAPRRQQQYLNALQSMPSCDIHYGNFLTKRSMKPRVKNGRPGPPVEVYLSEEKGSDVNLGVHLVNDAHLDRFDVALVLSQDSDLLEPMRIVSAMGKPVGIIWLQPKTKVKGKWRAPSKPFSDASTFIKFARTAHYRNSQFADNVTDADGQILATKPQGW